jgi:hypothetical protein
MLVRRVPNLAGARPGQTRHVHPVVVDQPQREGAAAHGHQQDVAVLQVSVRDPSLAEPRRQFHPQVQEHLEVAAVVEVLLDELGQRQSFYPTHLQDRGPIAADTQALLQILEVNRKGRLDLFQMGGDAAVALALAGNLAGKALQGPMVARRRAVDLENVGEIARPEHRQAQRGSDHFAGAEFLVVHGGMEFLNGFDKVRRLRPSHGLLPFSVGLLTQLFLGLAARLRTGFARAPLPSLLVRRY